MPPCPDCQLALPVGGPAKDSLEDIREDIFGAIIANVPDRAFEASHPHIDFRLDLRGLDPGSWSLLGEAKSKSQHVSLALLSPATSQEMMQVYLARGVMATTAIEGNTLSEDEVRAILEGELKLPPSRQYLQQEVENVLGAYNDAFKELTANPEQPLTVDWFKRFNARILEDLELEEGVVPGEIRDHSVVVGRYRGAPAEDCEYLLERLCQWLASDEFDAPADHPELAAPLAIVKAIVAHLYLAWIHPFGDGNGRTARLFELQVLLSAGFPPAACQLLSNHYNLTRTDYYRRLDQATRENNEVVFISYAIRGFVDQLKEQLDRIWRQQFTDRWEQFVYQTFGGVQSETKHRRLRLVLAVSKSEEPVPRAAVPTLTPVLARAYADKTSKTVTRDLNAIQELGLLRREPGGFVPANEQIVGLGGSVSGVLDDADG
ncbi:MAG: Fic family protein [Solirubrobacterales bacterium]